MSRDEIAIRARKVVTDHFASTGHRPQPKDFADDATFADLGADSLDVLEISVALEDAFDIEVPDDAAENILTVGQAVDYLAKRLGVAVPA